MTDGWSPSGDGDHPKDGWRPVSEAVDGVLYAVGGGVAYRAQGQWYTVTGEPWPGRPIQWDVTHVKSVDPETIPPIGSYQSVGPATIPPNQDFTEMSDSGTVDWQSGRSLG